MDKDNGNQSAPLDSTANAASEAQDVLKERLALRHTRYEPERTEASPSDVFRSVPNGSSSTASTLPDNEQSAFCPRCKQLGLPTLFQQLIDGHYSRIHLWIWSSTWEHGMQISCPCCKLLDYAMRYYEKAPEVDEGHFYFLNRAAGSTQLHFVSISKLLELSIRKPRVSFPWGPCSYLEGQIQSRTDLSLFRKKFQSCATRHSSCSKLAQPLHQIIGLKVIDCRSRQVIEAPSDCGYVALSYLWGPPSLDTSDDLQNPPKTIADAISVILGLGLAFLWVDRYCVSQENYEEQHHQLQQMGLIYNRAQVTINAAAGNDPTHGLPGISSNRPKRAGLTNIGQYAVFPPHKSLQELVSESVWMTRAWTYQEFFFSRRRLWFTDQKAFFDCQEGTPEECAAYERDNTNSLARRNNLRDILSFSHKKGIYRTYEIITHYCMRRLTYPSDILNGVLGILSTFKDTSGSVYHVCGMPYSLKDDNPQIPLLWLTESCDGSNPTTRRPGFPSWSWTGWEGVPKLGGHLRESTYSTKVEVEIEDRTELLSLKDFATRTALEKFRERFAPRVRASGFLSIEGWTLPMRTKMHGEDLCGDDLFLAIGPGQHSLIRSKLRCVIPGEESIQSRVLSQNGETGTLTAFVLGLFWFYSFSYPAVSVSCMVVATTVDKQERLGVISFSFKSPGEEIKNVEEALSRFRRRFPRAKKERIRLG